MLEPLWSIIGIFLFTIPVILGLWKKSSGVLIFVSVISFVCGFLSWRIQRSRFFLSMEVFPEYEIYLLFAIFYVLLAIFVQIGKQNKNRITE